MISLLFVAIVLFILSLLLLINAFILWDSENVVRSISNDVSTSHINIWAILSLIFAILGFVFSMYIFWMYYKSELDADDYDMKSVDKDTDIQNKRIIKSSKLMDM